jgi:hypothetical protein
VSLAVTKSPFPLRFSEPGETARPAVVPLENWILVNSAWVVALKSPGVMKAFMCPPRRASLSMPHRPCGGSSEGFAWSKFSGPLV